MTYTLISEDGLTQLGFNRVERFHGLFIKDRVRICHVRGEYFVYIRDYETNKYFYFPIKIQHIEQISQIIDLCQ